jgi:hypothetical protein
MSFGVFGAFRYPKRVARHTVQRLDGLLMPLHEKV